MKLSFILLFGVLSLYSFTLKNASFVIDEATGSGIAKKESFGAYPEVVDWDGDSVEDLLVGTIGSSPGVLFYKNYGTNLERKFKGYIKLPITAYKS